MIDSMAQDTKLLTQLVVAVTCTKILAERQQQVGGHESQRLHRLRGYHHIVAIIALRLGKALCS